jgi:hypothetical protein
MAILSILTFLFGLMSFFYKKRHITLICILLLVYNYFNFASAFFSIGPFTLQHSDLGLLLIFLILPFRKKINNQELKYIKRALIIFLLFLTTAILYDFIFQGTTASQIFRSVRNIGFLFFFFIINSFSFLNYKRLMIFLTYFTVIHSLIYISQYVFNFSFFSNTLIETDLDGVRYSNSPPFITIVLVLLIFKKKKHLLVYSQIFVVLLATLLTLSRAAVVSSLVVVLLYIILKHANRIYKLIIPFSIVFSLAFSILAYSPLLKYRFVSTANQASSLAKIDFDNLTDFYHQGSLTFRLGLTFERLMYVLDDTKRIILGVGFVPDIDIKRSIFVIGTKSDLLPTGYEQYNSGDILYPNIITRYGILGSFFFLYFLFSIFSFFKSNIKYNYAKISYVYIISMLLLTFNNQSFYQSHVFVIFFILIGMILTQINNDKLLSN